MLLEKEVSDFNSDMYLDLIMEFNNGIEFSETNTFSEEEDLRTLSVDHLMNRLEKSLSVSVDKVEKMLNKKLEASDLIRLCHIGIELANAQCRSSKRRMSAGSDESPPNKRKSKGITVKTPIQNSIPTDLERRITEMDYSSHTGLPTDLDDNKKRWLVIGICLHSILSPALRKYVEPVVIKLYNSLKLSHQIDKQTYKGHLKGIYGKRLNYKTINKNNTPGNQAPHYDYKVQNAVDLSKLFLETNMAHYKGFDETCDASALFGIIVNIDKFHVREQNEAKNVRSEIRNRWAHCNFTEWNYGMYNKSLQKIEDFIILLPLNATEKSQTIGELNKWKTNGTSYLKDTTLGLELVNDIRQQIQLLVEYEKVMCKSADTEFSKVYTELTKIGETLSWHDTRISSLENNMAIHETKLLKCKSTYDAEPLINTWNQKMKHFVKTDVVNDILDLLKVCHCVLLTGVSGMGKTLTAQNIALHLCHEQKYSIVPCSNLNDIERHYSDAYNQVFFIDDICGRFTTNRQKIEDWMRLEEFLKPILRKGMTKILATCRTEVFLEEIFQATFELFNKSSYNLTEKYSFKDKLVIARKYLNQDEDMLSAILRNVDFTPLMCYLCTKHEHFDINDFLNSPYDTFCKEWNKLKSLDKEKYCVLFLCVLSNGKIDESIVDISKELDKDELRKLGDIFECCNLGRDTSRSAIKDKLNACIDTYFIKVDKEYKIIHDKMFDFLCCYFAKALITQILKFADDKLICERVQLESIQKPNSEFTIIISKNDESKYMERLKKDIENGKIHWCLNNVQMRYKEYREKIVDLLENLDYDLKTRIINIKDVTGINSYITSCLRGYEELVNFFLSAHGVGTNVDARNGWFTPLTAACRDGHLKTVEILLNKGSHIDQTNVDGETPLYTACFGGHYALVELLIDRSADINKRNNTNHSPLYVSCLSGHDNIARLLIKSGVDVFECSDSLIGATWGGIEQIVETLLTKEVDVNVDDMQGRTALFIACQEGNAKIVKLLIDYNADIYKVDSDGRTPLHAACSDGNNDIVRMLIEKGADINMLDVNLETPLHKACRKGSVCVILTLLDYGADTRKTNSDVHTSVCLAKAEGKIVDESILKALVEDEIGTNEGSNVTESTKDKCQKQDTARPSNSIELRWTPLYEACVHGDIKTAKLLIRNRADVNMKTGSGEMPLVAACQQGHGFLIQLLLKEGADVNEALCCAVRKDYDRTIKILLYKGGNVSYKGVDEKSLLTLACEQGSIKTVKILLEKGADFKERDVNGHTLLHVACNADIVDLLQLLIDKSLDLTIPDKNGRYPLFVSLVKGSYHVSNFLIKKNCPIAISEEDTKTALKSVFESGNNELSKMLVSNSYTENLSYFNETMLYHAYRLGLRGKVEILRRNENTSKETYKYGYTPLILADIGGNTDLSEYLQNSVCSIRNTSMSNNMIGRRMRGRERFDTRSILPGDEYLLQACMNGVEKWDLCENLGRRKGYQFDFFFATNEFIWFNQTPLCLAISRGHTEVVKFLIKKGVDVNLTFEENGTKDDTSSSLTVQYGYTPLFAACQRKYYKIVDMLLKRGANVNKALYDACREGYLDTVNFLLQKGADVNAIGRFGQTALYASCVGGYSTIVKCLIGQGFFIDTKVKRASILDEHTCLHAAYQSENHTIVQLLIDSGASVDIVGNFGQTLIHKACRDGNYKLVEILISKGVDINASDMYGATPLIMCVLQNSEENAFVYELTNYKGFAMFYLNEQRGDYFDQLHKDYVHKVHELKTSCFGTTYKLLTENHYKVIKLLVENRADLEKADKKGRTPLSLARQIGDMKLADLLSYNMHKK